MSFRVLFVIGFALLFGVSLYPTESWAMNTVTDNEVTSANNTVSNPDQSDYRSLVRYVTIYHPGITKETAGAVCTQIIRQSQRYDMDPKLLGALISLESGFYPKALGRGGAGGLGQLMPGTARRLGVHNRFDIEQNVAGTACYLSGMLNVWRKSDAKIALALASYNRGAEPIIRAKGQLNRRTKQYVNAVMARYEKIQRLYAMELKE